MKKELSGRWVGKAAQRGGVFLVAIILAGIGLSFTVNNASNAVRNMAHPLVQVNVPTLRGLAGFESALLRYQLALNKHYAGSITRERFFIIEKEARDEMAEKIHFLLDGEMQGVNRESVNANYQAILDASPQLDTAMTNSPPRWDDARNLLLDLNKATIAIRSELDKLQDQVERKVSHAGERVVDEVDEVSWIIHSFIAATLVICVFLIYQFRQRARFEDELAFQAWNDSLTGLPNRSAFERRVQTLGTGTYSVALGVIDRFERVTAGLGHAFADQLVRELMGRAQSVAQRHNAELFRLVGSNFAILFPAISDSAEAYEVIEALQAKLNEPFELEQREIKVSVSLGIADYPIHGSDAVDLLKNADAALQAARQDGDSGLMTYSSELNARAQEKIELEAALSHSLERNELELYYQPQMSLSDESLVGFEALIRWRRKGSLVSPADFIPIAETSGLIIPIGDWILEEACRQAKAWSDAGGPKVVVAVNISPRQFRHPEFLSKVSKALQQSGVDPSCIELEITEGIVMEGESSVALLRHLRQLGVTLAVDDFGTGYSSLSYLKHFPIDKLKIDQSFIRQLQSDSSDAAIVKAVIALGHNLGVKVIAEGVESSEQRILLAKWACDEIQGYGYGKPMPREQATTFMLESFSSEALHGT